MGGGVVFILFLRGYDTIYTAFIKVVTINKLVRFGLGFPKGQLFLYQQSQLLQYQRMLQSTHLLTNGRSEKLHGDITNKII